VVTNPGEKNKSALYNNNIFPKVGIVDPELMLTVPPHITASTGFDAFTHACESYLHVNASPYTDMLALEAIRRIGRYLPVAVEDGSNLEAREAMAWADSLAGMSIANAGTTLPHGIGQTIGGYHPHVMHGEGLAVIYPEFMRFTYPYAVERFAAIGRALNPNLASESDERAAERSCEEVDLLLKTTGMWLSLENLGVPEEDVAKIADHSQVLPDYKANPRIADRDDIYEMLVQAYRREQA
jgi:alcohol dehydrogenase class IV